MARTGTASRPARRSASSASRRDRWQRCRSRLKSAASGARSSTATATTATAERNPKSRGRFAPSPTGRLHLGSLLAAVGSYLDARAQGGEWLVRIEDIDRGREVPGAAADILRTLEAYGLTWDGPVLYQSRRGELYAEALERLGERGLTYACSCSRAEIGLGGEDAHYAGTCRAGPRRRDVPLAIRFRTDGFGEVVIDDRLQGPFRQLVERDVGDFVLQRRDGFWSYQLAVVVDDSAQGITDVVRGMDLLDNTPRQRLLQRSLALSEPRTLHLPLLVDADGGKLSKSRQSLPVSPASAGEVLTRVLTMLRHPPDANLQHSSPSEQLAWAVQAWNYKKLQGVTNVFCSEPA